MDLLLKILKISALVALIFVLAVLFAPTLKGPFVIIHFSTALRAWLFAQFVLLGVSVAAHLRLGFRLLTIARVSRDPRPLTVGFSPTIEPLRC